LGTANSFQGQERDIIAITLTHNNPQKRNRLDDAAGKTPHQWIN
jgi:superfamily I DNA and/or RNA helicase